MASNRIINLNILLFEHDDEKEFISYIISMLNKLNNNFDIGRIDISFDKSLQYYVDSKLYEKILKVEKGSHD